MGVGECIGNLDGEVDCPSGVQEAAGDGGLQGLARSELRYQEDIVLGLTDFVERRDVGMIELFRRASIAQQRVAPRRVVGRGGIDGSDRHRAAEARVAPAPQLAETAGANPVERLVVPENLRHE